MKIPIMIVGNTLFRVRMLTEHRAVCSKQIVMRQYSIWTHNAAWKYPKIVISENFFNSPPLEKNLQKKLKEIQNFFNDIKKNKIFFPVATIRRLSIVFYLPLLSISSI